MNNIFVIKQLWVDTLENSFERACGYKIIGFCNDPEVIEKLKAVSIPKSTHAWPLDYIGSDDSNDVSVFRFQEIKLIDDANTIISNFKL